MKKTLTLMLAAVATFSLSAANYFTVNEAQQGTPVKMENVKKAPAGMQAKMMARLASQIKATPNFPASTPDDLVGGYAWTYRQYTGGMTTQPDTISNNYTFKPSYLNESLETSGNCYALNAAGSSFNKVTATTNVSAFRPYFTGPAASARMHFFVSY